MSNIQLMTWCKANVSCYACEGYCTKTLFNITYIGRNLVEVGCLESVFYQTSGLHDDLHSATLREELKKKYKKVMTTRKM